MIIRKMEMFIAHVWGNAPYTLPTATATHLTYM